MEMQPQYPPVVTTKQYAPAAQQPAPPQYQPSMLASHDVQYKENANAALDKKELLQKKLEMEDYNPFGRGGAGAPMKDFRGEIITHRKPAITVQQYSNYPMEQYSQSPPNGYQGYSQQNIPQSSSQYLEGQQLPPAPAPYSPPMQSQPQPQYTYQPAPPPPQAPSQSQRFEAPRF